MISEKNLSKICASENHRDSLMPKRLEGQVAIITGGARGIGEATVRLFVEHGAKVVIADIEDALGTALAASLSPSATYVRCDVGQEEHVKSLVDTTVSSFGRLDIIFNNAGILGNQSGHRMSIMEFNPEEFDRIMRVNVKGTALGMKHAARVMVPARRGCIISMSSVAGFIGGSGPHAYTASKHAIVGLTKNTACELGKHGIRVNCISPFGVATSMLIKGWRERDSEWSKGVASDEEEVAKMEEIVRDLANLKGPALKANDIAEAALYLASDQSRYVSGHNLVVDGGYSSSKNCVGL